MMVVKAKMKKHDGNCNKSNQIGNVMNYLEKNEINTDNLKEEYEGFIKKQQIDSKITTKI